jgi:hypothetical protein
MATKNRAVVICKLGTVAIDACKEESHDLPNVVTDHPVEEGFNITDHVRPEPDKVRLSCFISNTPLSTQQQGRAVQEGSVKFTTNSPPPSEVQNRAADAFAQLKKIRDEGTLVKVVTTLKTYGADSSTEGMVIEALSISRTAKNYNGLEFMVQLKQIRVVRNRATSDVRSKDTRTGNKKKKGHQVTKAPPSDRAPLILASEKAQQTGNIQIGGLSIPVGDAGTAALSGGNGGQSVPEQ